MDNRRIEDLLDEHSRALPMAGPDSSWLSRLPEAVLTVAPLVLLAREIAGLLVPVQPRSQFRSELHDSLVVNARLRQAQAPLLANGHIVALTGQSGESESGRRWMWGAAAVGSALSLAGILAYVLHQRGVLAHLGGNHSVA